jgi:hypothetical protein
VPSRPTSWLWALGAPAANAASAQIRSERIMGVSWYGNDQPAPLQNATRCCRIARPEEGL